MGGLSQKLWLILQFALIILLLIFCYGLINKTIPPQKVKEVYSQSTEPASKSPAVPQMKRILFWTTFYGSNFSHVFEPGEDSFIKQCKMPCVFSRIKSKPESFDALVFCTTDPQNPPKNRTSNQVYIALTKESPAHRYSWFVKGDFYNWSLTELREATISSRDDILVNLTSDQENPHSAFLKRHHSNKQTRTNSSLVLWIVSNCRAKNRRELYVQHLQKYVPVDIYGNCGKKCKRSWHSNLCMNNLAATGRYKFYLAFENSACKDYITEKTFRALTAGLVPVVLGGLSSKDYSYPGLLPPNSYIDVRNFTTPRHLAEYLRMLDDNDELYLTYHAWRSQMKVVTSLPWLCQTCDALYDEEMTKPKILNWGQFYRASKFCDMKLVDRLLWRNSIWNTLPYTVYH